MTEETAVVSEQESPAESQPEVPLSEVSISKEDAIRAAVNEPKLAEDEFKLGSTTYKVVDLPYDDYLAFVSMLSPLLDAFISKVTRSGPSIPGIELDTAGLTTSAVMKYCGTSLPEMVRIICSQSSPDVSVEHIKKEGKNPFKLAAIVLLQIARNNVIGDFASFFQQIAPLLTLMR